MLDRKSGSAGMPRPISYAVFCLQTNSNTLGTAASGDVDCVGEMRTLVYRLFVRWCDGHRDVRSFPTRRSSDLLLAVLLLLLLVAPCLNCLEAVKKPPPVAFKVMCLLPITIL